MTKQLLGMAALACLGLHPSHNGRWNTKYDGKKRIYHKEVQCKFVQRYTSECIQNLLRLAARHQLLHHLTILRIRINVCKRCQETPIIHIPEVHVLNKKTQHCRQHLCLQRHTPTPMHTPRLRIGVIGHLHGTQKPSRHENGSKPQKVTCQSKHRLGKTEHCQQKRGTPTEASIETNLIHYFD